MAKYRILTRQQELINTDPQRRCYNGCHYKSELVWTVWEVLEYDIDESRIEERLKFWKDLNDYAVSQGGQRALREFKTEKTTTNMEEK